MNNDKKDRQKMNLGKLEIRDMRFFARHGCFEEERLIGNTFIVDFEARYDVSAPSRSDRLEDAVNYQLIYNIIKQEMEIPSNMVEHVAGRILDRIKNDFPQLSDVSVSISKLNPPIGGQVGAFRITMSY